MRRAQATPEELEEGLTKLRDMDPQARYVWFANRLAKRAAVGQSCTITAFKPHA
eukprot:COSAG02_NODE_32818_length_510_cov_0.627737_1_plen_54_part_00